MPTRWTTRQRRRPRRYLLCVLPQAALGQHVETLQCVKSAATIAADFNDDEMVFTFAERRYRVRGLPRNLSPETLKLNLLLVAVGEAYHVDTLDLYSAKGSGHNPLQAAKELGVREEVIKHDLGRILSKLEATLGKLMKNARINKNRVP
jgi:hypothetical protein